VRVVGRWVDLYGKIRCPYTQNPILPFEICVIDFMGPFQKRDKWIEAKYIIEIIQYLTKWAEEEPVESCKKETAVKFIYENIVTIFGCPLTIINDQGTHFINGAIQILLNKFMIDNRKTLAYQA
jgi:hypothetical protein